MKPYLETGFRLRWLWVAALLVWAGLALLLWRAYTPEYEVVARFWIRDSIVDLSGPGLPPEQEQTAWRYARTLSGWMSSDTFMLGVVAQTPLRAALTTPDDRRRVLDSLARRLQARAVSERVLEVRYTSDQPEIAPALVNALAAAFVAAQVSSERAQLGLAIDFYGRFLQRAEADWLSAREAVRSYALASPGISAKEIDSQMAARGALDDLLRREQRARQSYTEWTATIERFQLMLGIQETNARSRLQLIDGPIISAQPIPVWRTMGLRLVAITVLVLAAALATVLIATWLDPTARRPALAGAALDLAVLGSLPRLRRPWWRRRWSARRLMFFS